MAAQEQSNWMPAKLGPMSLRPGLGYLGSAAGVCRNLPFVFSISDKAKLELSNSLLRVWVSDALVTRPAVTAVITNGTFDSNLTGWTDSDESGGTSAWVTGGFMGLTGNGTAAAIRQQAVTPNEPGRLHALRIVVTQGPVTLRVGSTSLGSEYIRDTHLGVGTHSITVTPSGTFYVQLRNTALRIGLVDSCVIESSGVLALPTPYAESDLRKIRFDQSGDVVYLACAGKQQMKIERRSGNSWSVVKFQPNDGPFRIENVGPTTIEASALTGNITLEASASLFDAAHVGALWQMTSAGQRIETQISAENVFSAPIRIATVGEARRFAIVVDGTFSGTVTLQRSIGEVGAWVDIDSWTAPTATTRLDPFDNQIVYWRIGVKVGNYSSGPIDTTLNYSAGSITGVVRITAVADDKNASAEVLSPLGGVKATDIWAEGQWSDFRGWPSSVSIHDLRLLWAGNDRFNGSISDQYENHDAAFEGDAGPISRSVGFGPVDSINWLVSLSRLIAGTDANELSCRASSLDEPLTPTNFNPKKLGSQGTAPIQAIEVDNKAIFVQRSGIRLYELAYSLEIQDYAETDLTQLCPEFLMPGVAGIAVQRQPDTRIHVWRTDGTAAVLVFDKVENLICWIDIETDGEVEDVCVLPGLVEDEVTYVVNRAGGRFHERWALQSEARGGNVNKMADSFVYAAGSSSVITGLGHLEGQVVIAWGGGQALGSFTVSGGQINLGASYSHRCAGLPYEARFKSVKLGSLTEKQRITKVGLVLADTHPLGLTYGEDFDSMDNLPLIERGAPIDTDEVVDDYDEASFTFPGTWGVDKRVCLKAVAPYPATVMAALIEVDR